MDKGTADRHAKRVETLAARAKDRFWAKVDKTETCWLWTANTCSRGYGHLRSNKVHWLAHRLSYTWAYGPIPDGLEIDHLCRVRNCVRPDHLEAVTHTENVRRGGNSIKTHCPQGHPLQTKASYGRWCPECSRARAPKYRAARKAAA